MPGKPPSVLDVHMQVCKHEVAWLQGFAGCWALFCCFLCSPCIFGLLHNNISIENLEANPTPTQTPPQYIPGYDISSRNFLEYSVVTTSCTSKEEWRMRHIPAVFPSGQGGQDQTLQQKRTLGGLKAHAMTKVVMPSKPIHLNQELFLM